MKIKIERDDGHIFNAVINDAQYEELRIHLLVIELGEKLGVLK